ncbi:hypothetical protein vseg_018621 [Gypsophila vaccaria]
MSTQNNVDVFESYFRRADLDGNGKISGTEAVAFFQGANLSNQVLVQIWNYADQNRTGSLGRPEFYNALKLVTVAQRKRELTPDIVKAALYGQASATIPAPQINLAALPPPQTSAASANPTASQMANGVSVSQNPGIRPALVNSTINQAYNPPLGSGLVRPPSGAPVQVASSTSKPPVAPGVLSPSIPQPRPTVTQNGFASGSHVGVDSFSAARLQPKIYSTAGNTSASSTQVPSPPVSVSAGGLNVSGPVPNIRPSGPPAVSPQASTGHQPQLQWPRATPTDIQKYTKVFMEVDTDKDGKITGAQARNLFLSWRLPMEVLKQVWDLSDQDNDSMLSLREFCIALYLMERFREGRPLPAVLPSNVMLDFPVNPQPPSAYGNSFRGYSAGFPQPQGPGAGQRPSARPPGKPPLPIPAPLSDDRLPPKPQKAKVPVLEKHLVDQLSEEEQKSLNLKFQEASEANKKVEDLEKEIKDSREKMEFYRVKLQELVLYKSRCDSRLNEVTERAAGDKREVESLAKKYEEKYLQAGNVASKLTIEEATFRDIQERKMETYQSIVKMEQDGSDETLQVRADHIQSNLEELVRGLSERCKKYGLRSKPTTLVELPFGWQPGIQEGAADWDEEWDKFEDEGFTFVKEMTRDVQNVIAPPKPKVKAYKKEKAMADQVEAAVPASDAESKPVKPAMEDATDAENGIIEKEDKSIRSSVASPSAKSSHGSPRDVSKEKQLEDIAGASTSPRFKQSPSDIGFSDTSSGDKRLDEPTWGTFDISADADSVSSSSKVVSHERHIDDLFGHGEFTLPPIRTSSSQTDDFLPKKIVFDSVPGTPADEFVPKKSIFADSVPGTPADGFLPKHSIFADSVPSTPLYNLSYSPPKDGGGQDEHSYKFSRFDSFRSTDSGFQPNEKLSRFDSIRSTREFDSEDSGSFQQRDTFSRFDSMKSTNDSDFGLRFSSFDDSDPFGSGAFKSSFGSETPRRDSDAFQSSAFRSSMGSETPRSEVDPFGYVGPFRSSLANETPRTDSDSYGQPFRSSLGGETPRADTDFYGSAGPFASSFGAETPRADANYFGSGGTFGSSMGSETLRRETDYFANSASFKSSFDSETPRGEFDSFGFGGPFGSSFSSETPRRDADTYGSAGPFKSSKGSEKSNGGTDSWSAF